MTFKPALLVHHISQFMKLEAGDVITTRTPPGIGLGKTPPIYIKSGDVIELSIEHLGSQQQNFI